MDSLYLEKSDFHADPLAQFALWFTDAQQSSCALPHAITLATADASGKPTARMVLLKDCDERGFTFYTNLASAKARDLQQNPHAALVFHWEELRRQVRATGPVEKISTAEADAYFATRPRGAQLGAWASPQSQVLENRGDLEREIEQLAAQYAGVEVPRPPHWGGYRLLAECIEFWLSRQSRPHDRFVYQRHIDRWHLQQLAP